MKYRKLVASREAAAKAAWLNYIATHELPPDIPPNPDVVYKSEWRGWCDWLGFDGNGPTERNER